jgi:hypothetical protein
MLRAALLGFVFLFSISGFSRNKSALPAVPIMQIGYNENTNFENRTCREMIQIFSNYMHSNKLDAEQEFNRFKTCHDSCIAPSFLSDCRSECYSVYEQRMQLHDQVVGSFLNALRARIAVYDVLNVQGPNRNRILNPSCTGVTRNSATENDQMYYQRVGFQCGRSNELDPINQTRAAYSSPATFQERQVCANFRENVRLWRDRFAPQIRINPFASTEAIDNQRFECPIRWTPETNCEAVLSNTISSGPGCYMDLVIDCQVHNGASSEGARARPSFNNRNGSTGN